MSATWWSELIPLSRPWWTTTKRTFTNQQRTPTQHIRIPEGPTQLYIWRWMDYHWGGGGDRWALSSPPAALYMHATAFPAEAPRALMWPPRVGVRLSTMVGKVIAALSLHVIAFSSSGRAYSASAVSREQPRLGPSGEAPATKHNGWYNPEGDGGRSAGPGEEALDCCKCPKYHCSPKVGRTSQQDCGSRQQQPWAPEWLLSHPVGEPTVLPQSQVVALAWIQWGGLAHQAQLLVWHRRRWWRICRPRQMSSQLLQMPLVPLWPWGGKHISAGTWEQVAEALSPAQSLPHLVGEHTELLQCERVVQDLTGTANRHHSRLKIYSSCPLPHGSRWNLRTDTIIMQRYKPTPSNSMRKNINTPD